MNEWILEEEDSLNYYSNSLDEMNLINRIIHGDNSLVLPKLLEELRGKVKCIFIDPPYNNSSDLVRDKKWGSYENKINSEIWVEQMKVQGRLLYEFLREDGSFWVITDDKECHYLKVAMDKIFGRNNFISTIIWKKNYSPRNDTHYISSSHDTILVYAKNKKMWHPNLMPRTEKMNSAYKNYDNDPRGVWKAGSLLNLHYDIHTDYKIVTPSGKEYWPGKLYSWRYPEKRYYELLEDNRIWFGKDGSSKPRYKTFITEVKQGRVCESVWDYTEVGCTAEATKESIQLFGDKSFPSPKPEKLLSKIIHISSNRGDIILDSFAGSGTTGAVAHKMGRHWILCDKGNSCYDHILPRIKSLPNSSFRFFKLSEKKES